MWLHRTIFKVLQNLHHKKWTPPSFRAMQAEGGSRGELASPPVSVFLKHQLARGCRGCGDRDFFLTSSSPEHRSSSTSSELVTPCPTTGAPDLAPSLVDGGEVGSARAAGRWRRGRGGARWALGTAAWWEAWTGEARKRPRDDGAVGKGREQHERPPMNERREIEVAAPARGRLAPLRRPHHGAMRVGLTKERRGGSARACGGEGDTANWRGA
jgi:hypothetical protein